MKFAVARSGNSGRGGRENSDTCDTFPGQISLHHGLMFHGSGPNNSSERRIGVAIRYVNPNAQQLDGSKEYALLVRGRDRNQNFIHFAPATRGFHPDEIELHQEILESKTAANY